MYYAMLIIGAVLCLVGVSWLVVMFTEKKFPFFNTIKALVSLLLGVLMLVITLPSLKYMILKEYDVVKGSCTIEVDSSGRSSEAVFRMRDTDEVYYFRDIPDLDAYGRAIPYYCELTVTKDHQFEIDYKIYDTKARKLLETSE
ncbi:hypothetical protein [Bacillus rubiinfantis]|uniref:hypothetical protein n=1 Tax=Bacillus rubiinfantis TaxID=1499680 RepID=UPI0005A69A97|nr:hypothetical protein [Bacillus rubiinfantis]